MKIILSFAGLVAALSALIGNTSTSDIRRQHTTDPSRSLEAALPVPENIRHLMNRACNNCHTYETKWPWYSRMAPVSWAVEYDVRRARSAANFSDWTYGAGKTKGAAMGTLLAACEGAKARRMPPAQYRLVHSEARLTESEIQSFCAWTQTAVQQIKAGKVR